MHLPLKKLQRALIPAAVAGAAAFGVLYPYLASASILSLLAGVFSAPAASAGASYNSQTIVLLTPARNIDPSPSVGGGDITLVAGQALLSQDGPDGTVADIVDRPSVSTISVYTVHRGDTLSQIAAMFGVSVNTIVWANDLKGGVIHEGDELVILPITGVRYTVQKGDTLASVATKYKADADEVAQYNDLPSGAALAVGSVIIIPDGEIAAPPAPPRNSGTTQPPRGGGGPALAGYFVWPVGAGIITQGLHGYNGVDIGAPTGTGIYAAAAGTVIVARAGGYNGGYGSYVVVQHDSGTQTLYAHMSRVLVGSGIRVAQGQTLGLVGATGKATGPHLHFEVRGAANPFAKLGVGYSQ